MNSSVIKIGNHGGVGVIALNRPKANAYTVEFMQALNDAIDQCESDKSVRVIVVQSDVPRFFCAGADIATFGDNDTSANLVLVNLAQRATSLIEQSNKIYIAAIEGHALGGGLEIALACDIRLGAEGSYLLGLPEVNLGLIPGNGGSQRLTRVVGMPKSLELCVTGDSVGPQEAHRIGLLNRLLPLEDFRQHVDDFAKKLAAGAPLAMSAAKKAVVKGSELSLQRALELESELVDGLYDSADAAEGFQAYVEKRTPKFIGE